MTLGLPRTSRGFTFDSIVVRAIVLVPIAMALWWFLLKPGSLWLLRVLAYLPLGLLIAPAGVDPVKVNPYTGEWVFNVAVNTAAKNPQTGQAQHIDSLEFVADEESLAFFASGWFSYLALALSAVAFSGGLRRNSKTPLPSATYRAGTKASGAPSGVFPHPAGSQAKRVLKGMGLQTTINILCLAAYAYINGYGVVINTPNDPDLFVWLFKYFYHLIYLVVPFAGPFMVALLVHPEWREYFTIPAQGGPGPRF